LKIMQSLAPAPEPPAASVPPTIVFSGITRAVLAAPPARAQRAPTPTRPAAPAPAGARPRPNGNGAWPAGTQDCWRCEIVWDSGYRTSRFHAVVRPPGSARGRVSGRSQAFRWMFDAAPQACKPEFVAAVGSLDQTLTQAGWRPVQPGPKWYARRYVWAGAEAPPLG
jgi:hypothetical protein